MLNCQFIIKNNMERNNYTHKILFIEDEKNLVDIYHDAFEAVSIKLLSIDNIDEAILLAEKEKPALILLDLILPVKTGAILNIGKEEGFRFLEMMKTNKKIKDIPVVVFTNLDSRVSREKAKALRVKDYIIKANYTPKEAVLLIKKFLT